MHAGGSDKGGAAGGAEGGFHWDMGPAGHIKSIKIGARGVIDYVAFADVFEGTTYETVRHGGPGGGLNVACNVLLPSKKAVMTSS